MVEDGLLLHLSKMPAFAVGRNLRLVRRNDALIITQGGKKFRILFAYLYTYML